MAKYEDMSKEELAAKIAELEKAQSKSKGKRKDEEYFIDKYPNVDIIPGSLRFLSDENKQAVDIRCNYEDPNSGDVCGEVRTVRTSDLHQVSMCKEHMAATKKTRKKAKQASMEAELAELRAKLADQEDDQEDQDLDE